MKAEQKRSQILGAILAFLASFGGIGVLTTAFQLADVSLFSVALVCAAAAAVFSLCAGFRGFPILLPILILIGVILWQQGVLNTSTEALLYQITKLYSMGYGWDVIQWGEQIPDPADATLALCALGVMIVLTVVWSFVRSRDSWAAILVAFLPLLPCIVLTDTVPTPFYLYLQLLSILLLLLPQVARKLNVAQSNRLTVLITLPVALALGGLFLLMPKDSYAGMNAAEKMDELLETLFHIKTPEANPQPPVADSDTPEQIDLSDVGPKQTWEIPVMDVLCDRTELLYLRGSSYDVYNGSSWVLETDGALCPGYADPNRFGGTNVTITTRLSEDVLYLPYHPQRLDSGSTIITNFKSTTVNSQSLREYTVLYSGMYLIASDDASEPTPLLFTTPTTDMIPIAVTIPVSQSAWGNVPFDKVNLDGQDNSVPRIPSAYLELDEDTLDRAQVILSRILPETYIGPHDIACLIAEYVSASAAYDLQTERMPADETDFAMWFLENSDTGYCTHYASAAAVLLRAAGIPARYVTGYLVDAQQGVSVTVMQKSAHAWVECYISGIGWVVLEATPSDGVSQTLGNEIPDSTESPETTEAEESTDATNATEASDTTEFTEPSQTEESTNPPVVTLPNNTSVQPPPGVVLPTEPSEAPAVMNASVRKVITISLLFLAAGVAVILQWRLRVMLRRNRRYRGNNNTKALTCWRDITLYCKIMKIQPDPALHALALKARFSQHTLTREELHQFYAWLRVTEEERIRRSSQKQRFLATLIYALY